MPAALPTQAEERDPVHRTMSGRSLTDYEVAADGESFRLNFKDATGEPASIELAADCANQLVLTMPRIVRQALTAKHKDPSLRLVYPLGGWRLELGAGGGGSMILTLATADGFEISFAVSADDIVAIGEGAEAPNRARVAQGFH